MSRTTRSFQVLAVMAAALVAVSCAGTSTDAPLVTSNALAPSGGNDAPDTPDAEEPISGEITVSSWGGVWTEKEQEYFGDPFTADTGVKVNYMASGTSPMSPVLLQAKSGQMTIDVVNAENELVMRKDDLAQPFPDSLKALFTDKLREGEFDDYQMRMGSTATIIVCNPKVMKVCPKTAEEFWDVKNFPGPRGIINKSYEALYFALRADGVPQDQVYPMDLDRAVKKLEEIKPYVTVWPSSGAEQQQVLIDGEVGANIMWHGRAYVVKRDSIPELELYWADGQRSGADGLMVPKGAPNAPAAFAYLKWIAEHPEQQAKWTTALTYPTPAANLQQLVAPEIWDALPFAHDDTIIVQDEQWISDHLDELQKVFTEFLAG